MMLMKIIIRVLALSLLLYVAPNKANLEIESNKQLFEMRRDCFTYFDSYDEWMDFLEEKAGFFKKLLFSVSVTKKEYYSTQKEISCNTFSYPSKDLIIDGFIIRPKIQNLEKLPVIIYNRGGNQSYGSITLFTLFKNIFPLVSGKYIVLASQYRGYKFGNESNVVRDQFGGKDVEDVVSLANLIKNIPNADIQNVFMVGSSRGGMMSLMALKQLQSDNGQKINAIATIGGDVDLIDTLQTRPEMENVFKVLIPNYKKEKIIQLTNRSALLWAEKLPQTPILIIHGSDDDRVAVSNAHKFGAKLTEIGHVHRKVIYEGDNHGLKNNKKNAYQEIMKWFSKYGTESMANLSESK